MLTTVPGQGREISKHLLNGSDEVPEVVRDIQYEGIADGIKAYLNQMDHTNRRQEMSPLPDFGSRIRSSSRTGYTSKLGSRAGEDRQDEDQTSTSDLHNSQTAPIALHDALAVVFQAHELEAALKSYSAAKETRIDSELACRTVIDAIIAFRQRHPRTSSDCDLESKLLANNHGLRTPLSKESSNQRISKAEVELEISSDGDLFPRTQNLHPRRKKKCYICCFILSEPHPLYPSLCRPCGAFNIAESYLSLPNSLDLRGKIAVVTGGRINLGFHTTLRLLRCGAKVIVTSRYPQDTEYRYLQQHDQASWCERLGIVGADFRTAVDVFQLVKAIKEILKNWSTDGGLQSLDILVNNAAQTLTDPISAEKKAIANEGNQEYLGYRSLIHDTAYNARVRGGTMQPWGLLEANRAKVNEGQPTSSYSSLKTESASLSNEPGDRLADLTLRTDPSSWMQSISAIPYEDFITAYSVNSLVPMILIRELMPLMAQHPDISNDKTYPPSGKERVASVPTAYILNISSREGIFEETPRSPAKNGKHLHTNMSKAALNSITQTEAVVAWKKHKIAINSVDPGYMSAAPEIRDKIGECPIGFEDGAGRVLWPVAMGERGEAVWGRFLKHFGKVEVDVGLGQ